MSRHTQDEQHGSANQNKAKQLGEQTITQGKRKIPPDSRRNSDQNVNLFEASPDMRVCAGARENDVTVVFNSGK